MARQASSAAAGIEEEIVIPPRIERGPTDILRALASTVGTDFTAPHYRYRYILVLYCTILISLSNQLIRVPVSRKIFPDCLFQIEFSLLYGTPWKLQSSPQTPVIVKEKNV